MGSVQFSDTMWSSHLTTWQCGKPDAFGENMHNVNTWNTGPLLLYDLVTGSFNIRKDQICSTKTLESFDWCPDRHVVFVPLSLPHSFNIQQGPNHILSIKKSHILYRLYNADAYLHHSHYMLKIILHKHWCKLYICEMERGPSARVPVLESLSARLHESSAGT